MTKCFVCQKKLKLVVAIKCKCRCTKVFCAEHIQTHKCSFDYKTLQKEKIIKENPEIVCDKLNKI